MVVEPADLAVGPHDPILDVERLTGSFVGRTRRDPFPVLGGHLHPQSGVAAGARGCSR
jgi:hypothetical protein